MTCDNKFYRTEMAIVAGEAKPDAIRSLRNMTAQGQLHASTCHADAGRSTPVTCQSLDDRQLVPQLRA